MKSNTQNHSNNPYEQHMAKRTLSIRNRIYIGFAAIALILIAAISLVLIKVLSVKDYAELVATQDMPTFEAFIDLNGAIYRSQSALFKWLLTHDTKQISERQEAWGVINNDIGYINQYKNINTKNYDTKWQIVAPIILQLKEAQDKIITNNSTQVNSTDALHIINTEITPLINKITDYLDGSYGKDNIRFGGVFDTHFAVLKADSHNIIVDMQVVEYTLYSLIIVIVLASLLIANYTSRAINSYINIFRKHSNNIATGDLTQRLFVNSNDDMDRLGEDLNIMTDSLAKVTTQINSACSDMITTLEEVRHASDVQSSGATEQASSINEITSSLEEIEKSSLQTIDKAKMLGEVAERTRAKGQQGLEAVEQSTLGMKTVREKVQVIAQTILDLSNQTQQIGEITAAVNTLAQQSKMLALNASIEAAKAGDAGKGFAVVAAEVKNLAEQSEHSTAQVQKILEDIRHATEKAVMATEEGIKGVDHGASLVEETGDIVRNLSDVIHEATIASQQIEAAIRQEGIGIEQITSGMNEINQVTYTYVESVKQTTEALSNLAKNVKNLKEYIDIYKV